MPIDDGALTRRRWIAAVLASAWAGRAGARTDHPHPEPGGAPRLRAAGRRLVTAGGAPFHWRGSTAFALLEQVAHGREGDARAFLEWARDSRFTVVRVLAMARVLFDLDPADGRRALPRLIELAEAHGLVVDVVALADSRYYPGLDPAGQVEAVGRLAASPGGAVMEVANEPYHPTQIAGLADPARLLALRRRAPAGLLTAFGAHADADSDAYRAGDFVTAHLPRAGSPWRHAARADALGALSERIGKPVVSGEPIGAAEQDRPGSRHAAPEPFFAMGLAGRLAGIGSTFHFEDGLRARPPSPRQAEAARAFVEGAMLVPSDARLDRAPVGSPGGPVAGFDAAACDALVASVSGARAWVAELGTRGPARIRWNPPWRRVRLAAERPGVRVWTAER